MQPAGLQQQAPRFQTPIRATRAMAQPQSVRTPRPRAATTRARAPLNAVRTTVTTGQQIVTTNSPMTPRQRVTLTRLPNPNHIQPIISVGTPKTVVSIATPPRAPNMVRTQLVYKTPQPQQTHIQSSPSTSNSSPLTEDLEDSIQAARITKQTTTIQTSDGNYAIVQQSPMNQQVSDDNRLVTLQSGTQMSVAEYKQRQASQSQVKQIPGIKAINRAVVQTRQPRFAAPNVVRTQRPVMVSVRVDHFARIFTHTKQNV